MSGIWTGQTRVHDPIAGDYDCKEVTTLLVEIFMRTDFLRIFAQKLEMHENLYKNFAPKVGARK